MPLLASVKRLKPRESRPRLGLSSSMGLSKPLRNYFQSYPSRSRSKSYAEVALGAREAAENIGKLSEKTGASVGTLSALALLCS